MSSHAADTGYGDLLSPLLRSPLLVDSYSYRGTSLLRSSLFSIPPAQLGRKLVTLVPRGEASIVQAVETKNFATRQLRKVLDGLPPGPHEAPPTAEVAWQHAQPSEKVVHRPLCDERLIRPLKLT